MVPEPPLTPPVPPAVPPAGAPAVPPAGAPAVPPAGAPAVPTAGAPAVPTAGAPAVPTAGAPAVPTAGAPAVPPAGALPYGPGVTRLLPLLRRGFHALNRGMVPALRTGLGPFFGTPVTGSLLVLRTMGHRSGLRREVPLGYALVDGRVVVVAGYGRATHWFRNALADPRVELVLPGAVLAGHAEEITDPEARRRAFRAVIGAEGVVGRLTVGDVTAADDGEVDRLAEGLPLLAVTPTGVLPGPFDPGGTFWRYPAAGTLLAVAALAATRRRRGRRHPCC